ncbi:hypothetical protein ACJ4V0_15685 [Phreatobacter sp. HK31-P]
MSQKNKGKIPDHKEKTRNLKDLGKHEGALIAAGTISAKSTPWAFTGGYVLTSAGWLIAGEGKGMRIGAAMPRGGVLPVPLCAERKLAAFRDLLASADADRQPACLAKALAGLTAAQRVQARETIDAFLARLAASRPPATADGDPGSGK